MSNMGVFASIGSGIWFVFKGRLNILLHMVIFALEIVKVMWIICCSILKVMLLIMSGGRRWSD